MISQHTDEQKPRIPETELDVPEPSFSPISTGRSVFLPQQPKDGMSMGDIMLYKSIMFEVLRKAPELHPELLGEDGMDEDEFMQLDDKGQRVEYRRVAGPLVEGLKNIIADHKFLHEVGKKCDCTFMDIVNCFYSYYGALMYKRPQFIRWIVNTVMEYPVEVKDTLRIPRELPEI